MSSPLPDSLHQILHRFDAAWNGPSPPRIERFALPAEAPDHLSLLVEPIHIDMEHRLQCGGERALDEYRRRFADCGEALLDSPRLVFHCSSIVDEPEA